MGEETLMWMRLGNTGRRFDAGKVIAASRTRAGRASVLSALSRVRASVRPQAVRPPKAARTSRRRLVSRQRAPGLATAASERPAQRGPVGGI